MRHSGGSSNSVAARGTTSGAARSNAAALARASAARDSASGSSSGESLGWVPPTARAILSGTPMLRRGDRGERVTLLQQLLNADGGHLATDGDFGPLTDGGVRAFQGRHRLSVDGIVGPQTAGALNGAASTTPPVVEESPGEVEGVPATVTVAPGESLAGIAARYGKPWRELYDANRDRIGNPNIIHTGTVLRIPASWRGDAAPTVEAQPPTHTPEPTPTPAPPTTTRGSAGEGDRVVDVGVADPKGILFDSRVNPEVRAMAAITVERLMAEGYSPYVYEGHRTYARQDSLSSSVTGVSGGGSYHQYGLAVDITSMTTSGGPTWSASSAYWQRLGAIGLQEGFTRWGGDWGDMVHLEYHPNRGSDRARSLEDEYRGGGGSRDGGDVQGGLTNVWEELGLDMTMDATGVFIDASSPWDMVLGGSDTLTSGDSGEAVRELQRLLNEQGAGLTVDGSFGPATRAAVEAYQADHGIPVDGRVGAFTASSLSGLEPPEPHVPPNIF